MADFSITDRRGRRPPDSPSGIIVARGNAEVQRALALGAQGPAPTRPTEVAHAAATRRLSTRVHGASSVQIANSRPLDPMFFWRESGLPYELDTDEKMAELREWCRWIYRTHPILGSVIDVFAQYPMLGLEFTCKDARLAEFYSSLFLDDLNYEEYLTDIGREKWTVGEAWPLGYFDETLGVWESDELLDPDTVTVEKSPFLPEPRFLIELPEQLRDTLLRKEPAWEYQALIAAYPDLERFAAGTERRLPISNVLLKQIMSKSDTFADRGMPRLLRTLRPVVQEEMLAAAQDAIASRLYTPLIHARIGASASDLGTDAPWIPSAADIQNFLADLDTALAADFRVLATHFATEIDSVFGRENMPDFSADRDQLTERQLMAFGMSMTMLIGAGQGETYAADALNRDLVSQLLTHHQRDMKRFVRDRAEVVAEAQGHFDYTESAGRRHVIMQEVIRITDDGERVIEMAPKLLVPEARMATMSLRTEEQTVQFIEALRASGIPVSMRTRTRAMANVRLDLDDEMEQAADEQVQLAVAEQQVRRRTYLALRAANLPVPDDLRADFEAHSINADETGPAVPGAPGAMPALPTPGQGTSTPPTRLPQLGVDNVPTPALAPTPADLAAPPGLPTGPPLGPAGDVLPPAPAGAPPTDPSGGPPGLDNVVQLPRSRPPESDEARAGMPTASRLSALGVGPRHLAGNRVLRRTVTPYLPVRLPPVSIVEATAEGVDDGVDEEDSGAASRS